MKFNFLKKEKKIRPTIVTPESVGIMMWSIWPFKVRLKSNPVKCVICVILLFVTTMLLFQAHLISVATAVPCCNVEGASRMLKLHRSCPLCALSKVMLPSGGCGPVVLTGFALSDCRSHYWKKWIMLIL